MDKRRLRLRSCPERACRKIALGMIFAVAAIAAGGLLSGGLALAAGNGPDASPATKANSRAARAPIRPDGRVRFADASGERLAEITVEIADTPQSQQAGLMGRTGLDDTMGMLFVYPRAERLTYWMHDTPTSLDIIFISDEGSVINIAAGTLPDSDTLYHSNGPARYVIEVPAFFCVRHHIGPGARLTWMRLAQSP